MQVCVAARGKDSSQCYIPDKNLSRTPGTSGFDASQSPIFQPHRSRSSRRAFCHRNRRGAHRMTIKVARAGKGAAARPSEPADSSMAPCHVSAAQLTGGKPILIGDDDADVVSMVTTHLSAAGFKVVQSRDGGDVLTKVRECRPSLAILDIVLPGLAGLEVCRTLKAESATANIPIIILTACNTEVDRVLSFELGADDYLTKPFSPRELVLRIISILRRTRNEPQFQNFLQVGGITLDRDRYAVTADGEQVALTAIEFKLLLALMEQRGRTLDRNAILALVWGFDKEIETRTVDTHIRRLREKLGASGRQIQTLRGFGYRLEEAQ